MSLDDGKMLCKDEVYAIVGAAMEVHSQLGAGFAEAVFQEALEIELALRGVPFERQVKLKIFYKGPRTPVRVCCRPDLPWIGYP